MIYVKKNTEIVLNTAGLIAADDFERSSGENPPAAPWNEHTGDWQIDTEFAGRLFANNVGGTRRYISRSGTGSTQGGAMYVQAWTTARANSASIPTILARWEWNAGSPDGYGLKLDSGADQIDIVEYAGSTTETSLANGAFVHTSNSDLVYEIYVADDVQEGAAMIFGGASQRISATDATGNAQNDRFPGFAGVGVAADCDVADSWVQTTGPDIVIDGLPTGWKAAYAANSHSYASGQSDDIVTPQAESSGTATLDCSAYGNGSTTILQRYVPAAGGSLYVLDANDNQRAVRRGVYPGDDLTYVGA